MSRIDDFKFLVAGLDHPEGVAWGPDGKVYAGGEAGQLYRVDLEAKTFEEVATTGGFALGIAMDSDANAYVCDAGKAAVMRISTRDGKVDVYSSGAPGAPSRGPNYPVFDRQGNLYYSENGDYGSRNGFLYKVDPLGKTTVWSRDAKEFTNGLALNPEETHLYVAESSMPGVSRIAINKDGSAGRYEVVARLERTVPDGLAFAADGTLLVASYIPDRIYTINPSGQTDVLAEDWTHAASGASGFANPTNIAFCGPKLDMLVVANLGGWHLNIAKLGMKGAPLNYPKLGN